MSTAADRVTVGVNPEGQKALDEIRAETEYFPDEQDAYRFAIAYSIGAGLDPVVPRGSETKFSVGTLDRDGRLRDLIRAAFPDEERPYALAEQLAHVGLLSLRTQLVESHLTFDALLSAAGDDAADASDTGEGSEEP